MTDLASFTLPILCAGDCHVFLGSSSLCTCEALRVAMYGYPAPYNPYSPHAPQRPTEVPQERLLAAQEAGARWLSADGMRAYCERYGQTLEAEWKEWGGFGAWGVVGSLPSDAVVLK